MENCSVKKLKNSINIEGLEKLGEYYEYSIQVVAGVQKAFSFPAKLGDGDSVGVLVEGNTLGTNVGSQNVRGITSTGQSSSSLLGQYKVGKMSNCRIAEPYKGIYIGIPSALISASGTAKITVKIPFDSMPDKTLISDIQTSLVNGTAKTETLGNLSAGLYYIECVYDDTVSFVHTTPIDININNSYYQNTYPYGFFNLSQYSTKVACFIGTSKFSGSGNLRIKVYKLNYE